jgi:hypothetical protein
MFKYAQINSDGLCISVSFLSGKVEAENMIHLTGEDVQPGDIITDGVWTRPEPLPPPVPQPSPEQIRIEQLENESAAFALELMETQIKLENAETEHATLILALVERGSL